LQFLEAVLDQAESSPDYTGPEASTENIRLFGQVMVSAANLALGIGLSKTIAYADRGAAIAREQGDLTNLVWSLVLAISRSDMIGDLEKAYQYHQEMSLLIPELDPGWVKAMVLTTIELNGAVMMGENVDQAWENWEIGMAMFRQGGEFWGLAYGYATAARASLTSGEIKKAQYNAQRSLSLFIEIGDTQMVNIARSLLADVAQQRGELDQAAHYYNQAISGWRNVDQYGAMARCLECLAFVNNNRSQAAGDEVRFQLLSISSTLLGAAAAIRRVNNTPMTPPERLEYDKELAQIKEAAGASAFNKAWLRGQVMDPDQAVAFAGEL
jgi:tetratricopeptide (TPR) repeat protein